MTPVCLILTKAEDQVVRQLLRDGASNQVIARRLGVSLDTVKSHLKSVYARLPMEYHDRAALCVGIMRGRARVRVLECRAKDRVEYRA